MNIYMIQMIHTNYGYSNSCIFKSSYDRHRHTWWNGNTGTSRTKIHAGVQELSQSKPSLTAMFNRCPQICLHYHGHTDTHTHGDTHMIMVTLWSPTRASFTQLAALAYWKRSKREPCPHVWSGTEIILCASEPLVMSWLSSLTYSFTTFTFIKIILWIIL